MYNGCLQKGVFQKRWKRAKLITIVKPGKEDSEEVKKFRPISLLHIEEKTMEKILTSIINYWSYSTNFINNNQYGFTPQRSTIDAAMAAKNIVDEGLKAVEVVILVSLEFEQLLTLLGCPIFSKAYKIVDDRNISII